MSNVVYLNIPKREVFRPGFNDVYCACGKHLAEHANRSQETPIESWSNPALWYCPKRSAQQREVNERG